MKIIQRIRQKILRNEFIYSSHTLIDKLPPLRWTTDDVLNGIKTGEVYRTLTADERGTRYVILGEDLNGYDIYIVCRFRADKNLILITVYEEYD
jgi:hypothetical protein